VATSLKEGPLTHARSAGRRSRPTDWLNEAPKEATVVSRVRKRGPSEGSPFCRWGR
jgi:hypothetical protein